MKAGKRCIWGNFKKGLICTVLLFCLMTDMASAVAAEPDMTSKTVGDSKIVRVGYYEDNEGFQFGSGDNVRKSGYAYEYYQEIARYTGWTYEYEYGSWSEIYEKLIDGEVDIMAGVSKLDSRMSDMLFPDSAMGRETYYIYVPRDKAASDGAVIDLDGVRMGVKANSYMQLMLEEFADRNNIEFDMIPYNGLEERIEDLEAGRLDCIVTVENDRLEGQLPVFNIGSSEFYFAVNKNRPDLLDELNEAQEEILSNSPYYASQLQNKYFNESEGTQNLTDKELEWLKAHPLLRVGYLTDYMPYCDRGENDELTGMLKVVLAEFSDYAGMQFICTSYDNYLNQ